MQGGWVQEHYLSSNLALLKILNHCENHDSSEHIKILTILSDKHLSTCIRIAMQGSRKSSCHNICYS